VAHPDSQTTTAQTSDAAPAGGGIPGRLLRRAATFIVALVAAIGLFGQHVYLTPLPRFVRDMTPATFGMPAYQDVALQAKDSPWGAVRLDCWYIPGPSKETVIALHGRGDSKAGLLSVLQTLNLAGYTTFALEFRAHGTSEGRWSTSGPAEQRDLEAAIDWVTEHHPAPVALFGYSMGGCVALEVAARDDRVRGVATEGAVADQVREIHRHFAPASYALIPAAVPWILARTGTTPWAARPVAHIKDIAPRPVLLIHSRIDSVVGFQAAQDLYAAAGEPKELWVLDNAEHVAGIGRYPVEYRKRLIAFYDKVFAGEQYE